VSNKATLVEDGYESSKVLMVSSSVNDCEWIMDSRYSFHMTLITWYITHKRINHAQLNCFLVIFFYNF